MMYATAIKMKPHKNASYDLLEIDSIYIKNCDRPDYYDKAAVHNYLKKHPGSICVNIYPFPKLIPATSIYGEKYVKSQANDSTTDNLLKLPRH